MNCALSLRDLLATLIYTLVLALTLAACAGPPKKALDDAEKALREAVVVSDCAQEEFREAEEMMAQAKALVEKGDYEEAEIKAKLAKKLADNARQAGEDRWEDCQKAKNVEKEVVVKPKDDIDNILQNGRLGAVYFDYDEATLAAEAQDTLQKNAEWMRRNQSARVQIEGHCDERGTTEYNIALGERRAVAVRKYLVQLGVESSRLSIISYGAEQPMVGGNSENSFLKNRRAEFLVKQ
jgi:peptidoglycan-associated lipoprotein